ncbi:unnamed protein product [Adineta steineri]|uniref:ADP-ribosylation factor-like protein 6 n=1 Tax=Adineta steineri TaxID=433720 RepID=A0A818T4A1_9BILA|nr:unnamed protein product [Adineta steineri]CAF3678642.1 unnamed protein product [Adineta steineri]
MSSSWQQMNYDPSNQGYPCIRVGGLAGAGKSTILHIIKQDETAAAIQAIGVSFEKWTTSNMDFTPWEYGGRMGIRSLPLVYHERTKALIFVIDSNDRNRINEACKKLHGIANEDELRHKPILIFANKQDLPNGMSLDELRNELDLAKFDGNTKWHIQAVSAIQNKGFKEGFEWLANTLTKKIDFTTPIIETFNDSMIMKNDLLSVLDLVNLKKFLKKFVKF